MITKYDDFDLQIEPAGRKYRVRLLNAPTGQATSEFALPFTDIEVSNFLSRIGQVRRTMRRVDAPEVQAAKEFGGKLFSAVFSGEMIAQLRGSIEQASDKEHGLRIRLRLTDVPGLADLPWEFLYDASQNHFLTTSVETPIVRFLDLPQRISPLRVALPLRVLTVIASPRNLKRLDTEGEWTRLQESLADLLRAGQIVLERLPAATLDALRVRARGAPFHVFHFIGHGGFDEAAQDGVLQFEDEQGMSYPVRGELLGMQLRDHRSLRLAVLNACEGARSSKQDPFSGVAQSLLQQRVPAVIAMQFEISDAAAKVFAKEFYRAIAEGNPVDAAVCESRRALFKEEFGQEWATPVLYMRSQEGQLFELQAVAPPPLPDADQRRQQAEEAERQAAAKVEAERLAAEKAEAERQAALKAAAERTAKLEKERLERALAVQEQLARERREKEEKTRQAVAKAETERLAAQRAEEERLAYEAMEKAQEAGRATQEKAFAEGTALDATKDDRTHPRRGIPLVLSAVAAIALVVWLVPYYKSKVSGPADPQTHFRMGDSLHAGNNLQGAILQYREAIRLKPDYAAAHAALGVVYRESGDLENAIGEFSEAIRLDPNNSATHNDLGLTLFQKGDFAGATAEYRDAIRLPLPPKDTGVRADQHYNLARALESKGEKDAAIAEYRETLRLNPNYGATHAIPELPPAGSKESAADSGNPAPVQPRKDNPSSPNPASRIRQGGSVQAARLIRRVRPAYPPLAMQARISGTVRLHAIIGKDGRVAEVNVLSGHPLLVQSAMDAVKQWRYRPTLLNGRPVEVDTTIDVEYALSGTTTSTAPPSQPTAPATSGNSTTTSPGQAPQNKSPCTFGKIEFSEQGNRLVGKVPYTYQGSYSLDSVALRGVPLDSHKDLIPGLKYEQSTLQTASGTVYFSVEGHPALNHQQQESTHLLISVVLKKTSATVCGEIVPYQRKW